jgi:hypothetical protein
LELVSIRLQAPEGPVRRENSELPASQIDADRVD